MTNKFVFRIRSFSFHWKVHENIVSYLTFFFFFYSGTDSWCFPRNLKLYIINVINKTIDFLSNKNYYNPSYVINFNSKWNLYQSIMVVNNYIFCFLCQHIQHIFHVSWIDIFNYFRFINCNYRNMNCSEQMERSALTEPL